MPKATVKVAVSSGSTVNQNKTVYFEEIGINNGQKFSLGNGLVFQRVAIHTAEVVFAPENKNHLLGRKPSMELRQQVTLLK